MQESLALLFCFAKEGDNMRKPFRHLTRADRIKIETMLNSGHSVIEISKYIGCSRNTIYLEMKKGQYAHRNTDWTEEVKYSSDLGQKKHDWLAQGKGRKIKIGTDIALANFLEERIADDKYSPEAALAAAKASGQFKTTISVNTLYRYIDAGIFLRITNKNLPVKGKRRKHNKKVRVIKRASAGVPIDQRPGEINSRSTFGHWEMDTVKGKRGVTKSCLLVLTERKTRNEIIAKMPDQGSASVVDILDRLERKWGDIFPKVFRSITVDNGVEFADVARMERSILHEGKRRTYVFYCHPYSSWERGSNENQNRLIRRHIPKGVDIDNYDDNVISYIENWINAYPRRMLGYQNSKILFADCLAKIG
jgi:IS30 family transposase